MIYDCFTLFNELDLLELRLMELDCVVDRFVIAEGTRTHAGDPKPLYLEGSGDRFKQWKDRIIYIEVLNMPDGLDHWAREHFQRNALLRGLTDAHPVDWVMFSDLDEIPKPEKIRQWTPSSGPCGFDQLVSYYWINCITNLPWCGTRITTIEQFGVAAVTPTEFRCTAPPLIPDGGWHLSYLGGVEQIRSKLKAFAHQEYNAFPFTSPEYILHAADNHYDLFRRNGVRFDFVPLDVRFPETVVANPNKWLKFIAPFPTA